MSEAKNIQAVVANALCTACGACSGVCPTQAIEMLVNAAGYLVAAIRMEQCTNCGLCRKVCPSVPENQVMVVGASDPFHGISLSAYIGHAVDQEIRQKSQSGGIVSALLCYLLEERLIQGAVVNQFSSQDRRPLAVYATTRQAVLAGAGSYYSQSSVVKTILANKDKRMAAVVLGCQAESLKLIRAINPTLGVPAYTIGLICAGQYSGAYIDELISLAGCRNAQINGFRFRDKSAGDWPGHVKIYAADKNYILDKKYRHMLKPVYEAYRCLLCFDQMNVQSDLVVGDPWGIDHAENKTGNSVIVVRTEKGKALLEGAVKQGYIDVAEVPVKDVIRGQTVDGRLKTQFFSAVAYCRQKGYPLPVNVDACAAVPYVNPKQKQSQVIKARLDYSRRVYLSGDPQESARLQSAQGAAAKRKQAAAEVMYFFKRAIRYALRRLVSCCGRCPT